jgi:hypothetical protein
MKWIGWSNRVVEPEKPHYSITLLARRRDAGDSQRLIVMSMMVKQPCPVLEEVPDNANIYDQND